MILIRNKVRLDLEVEFLPLKFLHIYFLTLININIIFNWNIKIIDRNLK